MKEKIFNFLKNKKIVCLGLGKSNLEIVKLLQEFDIPFTIHDKRTEVKTELDVKKNSKTNFFLGEGYKEHIDADIIFRSPGIPFFCEGLNEARKHNTEITSEFELFLKFCPCRTIGVTGSDGKTTTTTIIYKIFKKMNFDVFIGGNIGIPLTSLISKINKNSIIVMEFSSFQLISLKQSPNVAVFTNISPNHLDIHKDFDEYFDAKKNIYKFQNKNDSLVINLDDILVKEMPKEASGNVIAFSKERNDINFKASLYLNNSEMIILDYENKKFEILDKKNIKILGNHNLKNFLAAIGAVVGFFITNNNLKDNSQIKKIIKASNEVAQEFEGIEHRIEFVREFGGVKYYNDSIATSPMRVISGTLDVFNKDLILICGGYDKNLSFEELGYAISGGFYNNKKYIPKVKKLILLGQTSRKIKDAVLSSESENYPEIFETNSMEEAVILAKNLANLGDTVVLSPASASFDIYKNFEERGNDFKKIVNGITN